MSDAFMVEESMDEINKVFELERRERKIAMTKDILKMVGCFVGGLGIGGGAGYLVANKLLKKKTEDEIQATIDRLEEQYAESNKVYVRETLVNPVDLENYVQNESDEESDDKEVDVIQSKDLREIRERLKRNWDETTNYAAMYQATEEEGEDPAANEHPEDDDPEEEDQNEEEKDAEEAHELHQRTKYKEPTLISVEDLGNLPAHVDQKTLYYYQEDDVMTTEEDELVDDPCLFVGHCMEKYNFEDNDEERIFVMNYGQDTVYEVQKIFGSYNVEE